MIQLQQSVQNRLKKASDKKKIAVERDSCYVSSPKATLVPDLNLTSQDNHEGESITMQERASQDMRDQSTTIHAQRNLSLNFMGLLD